MPMPCRRVLPLFTPTEGGYCQTSHQTHWKANLCYWSGFCLFVLPCHPRPGYLAACASSLCPACGILSLLVFTCSRRCSFNVNWFYIITCSPGDGGNDVSMIQAAHAGVGIEGKVRPHPRPPTPDPTPPPPPKKKAAG